MNLSMTVNSEVSNHFVNSKTEFNLFEEFVFYQAHSVLGNKWSAISQLLPGRSDNNLKNHFYSTLRKVLRKVAVGNLNYANFTEKVKAFFSVSHILDNMTVVKTKNNREFLSFNNENVYTSKLLRRNKISSNQLNGYFIKLCKILVRDKFVRERLDFSLFEFSTDNVKRLVTSLVYYEAMKQVAEVGTQLHDTQEKNQILYFLQNNHNKLHFINRNFELESAMTDDNKQFLSSVSRFIDSFGVDSGNSIDSVYTLHCYEKIKSGIIIQKLFEYNKAFNDFINLSVNELNYIGNEDDLEKTYLK